MSMRVLLHFVFNSPLIIKQQWKPLDTHCWTHLSEKIHKGNSRQTERTHSCGCLPADTSKSQCGKKLVWRLDLVSAFPATIPPNKLFHFSYTKTYYTGTDHRVPHSLPTQDWNREERFNPSIGFQEENICKMKMSPLERAISPPWVTWLRSLGYLENGTAQSIEIPIRKSFSKDGSHRLKV